MRAHTMLYLRLARLRLGVGLGVTGTRQERQLPRSKQPDILQLRAEDSKKIVLVLPREGWYFHHRPSYLAASLKVPPPKKKIVRSEEASQRLIRDRQREGVTLRLRPRPARV